MRRGPWTTRGCEVFEWRRMQWQHYAMCRVMDDAEEIARTMNEVAWGEAYPHLPTQERMA